jgi:hypothetical protein
MSPALWVAIVIGVFVAVGLAQMGVRRLIDRLGRKVDRQASPNPDSWTAIIVARHRDEASRFDFDMVFWGWPVLLSTGFAIAAAVGGWGVGWSVFGFLFGAFSLAVFLTRIRYGSTRMRDVKRLLRGEARRKP